MKKYLTVPANFDAEKLIQEKVDEFPNLKGVTPQKLNYLVHCIIDRNLCIKDDYLTTKAKNGYVNLKAEYLRNVVRDYKNCLDFLKMCDAIKCDNLSLRGFKSFGYKLHDNYLGKGFVKMDVKGSLLRILGKQKDKNASVEVTKLWKTRSSLISWLYSSKFKIDSDAAYIEIEETYQKKIQEVGLKFKNKIGHLIERQKNAAGSQEYEIRRKLALSRRDFYKKRKELSFYRDKYRTLVDEINSKQFEVSIDESGRRLHTPITRLPKYLRKYLKYSDRNLIALDIKNSQPYLSLQLLKKQTYEKQRGKKSHLTINKLDKELYELLRNVVSLPCTKSSEMPVNTKEDNERNYRDDVLSGKLYDSFVETDASEQDYQRKRNSVKKSFLLALYDIPKASKRTQKFYDTYPQEFEIFNKIKSVNVGTLRKRKLYSKMNRKERCQDKLNNALLSPNKPRYEYEMIDEGYAKLACLLQRIESYVVLDVICKRIAKENPHIPLITVHDSIATTDENIEYLETVMKYELEKAIDFPPKLEHEYWK